MSAPVSTPSVWQWPSDVLEFAARNKVAEYLDPLLAATRRLFPNALSLKVFLEDDPEIRDDWHIVFEVKAPSADAPDYVKAKWAWTAEVFRIVPAPLICVFRTTLLRAEADAAVRAQIEGAMRVYERDVLGDVTRRP